MIDKIFPKEYFSERRLLALSGVTLLTMLLTITRILIEVRQYDRKVTVGYTQYGADTFQLGEWVTLYEPAVFAFITTIAALLISFRLFKIDRNYSYLVLALQLIVLVFTFIVSGALLSSASIAS